MFALRPIVESYMQIRYKIVLTVTVLSLIWSSTWVIIKVGLETMPPLLSAGYRFLIAFVFLGAFALKQRHSFPRTLKSHAFFIFFGIINFFGSYALVYWGEQYIHSGLTSVLFSIMPFYTALFSIKMLPSEKITLKKFIGISIGFCGILIIFNDQLYLEHPLAIYGMLAVLISPAFSALGTIVGKKARDKYHPVVLNTFPLMYSALTFFAGSLIFERGLDSEFTPAAIFSLFYLGILGTSIAFVLYFWILKYMSAVLMSLITFITPPLALIWGWVVLGEVVTYKLLWGMLIIFAGIFVVRIDQFISGKSKKKTVAATAEIHE